MPGKSQNRLDRISLNFHSTYRFRARVTVMKLLNFMAWRYEIRGTGNRLVQMRRGFATEKQAQQAGELSKKNLMQSVAYSKASETLTVVVLSDTGGKRKAATA